MQKRKTVGAQALELMSKPLETTNATEQMREQLMDYEKNFYECLEEGKKKYLGNFYVVVITKKERLMQNVLRNYFFNRLTCPTPDYDQIVYKYTKHPERTKALMYDQVDLLWCIPDRETSFILKENALKVVPEEKQLLGYVLDFADGTLYKHAKIANGEEAHSNILQS